ncbi:hypothetical protein J437_LFUL004218 [Ladona fulva]|uniref:Uncharacterized protein n=1 Tax=Ladona fulva TaxID=123851 RepID=A0A8K0NWR5_LADFU|nr:hypothetical protein J437_LFUL004218 [Ladona fulva]
MASHFQMRKKRYILSRSHLRRLTGIEAEYVMGISREETFSGPSSEDCGQNAENTKNGKDRYLKLKSGKFHKTKTLEKRLNVLQFTDDTSIFTKSKEQVVADSKIKVELKKVTNWFNQNLKTCVNAEAKEVTNKKQLSANYLGIMIDQKLNWSDHINYLASKLSKATYLISKLTSAVNLKYRLWHPSTESISQTFCITSAAVHPGCELACDWLATMWSSHELLQRLSLDSIHWHPHLTDWERSSNGFRYLLHKLDQRNVQNPQMLSKDNEENTKWFDDKGGMMDGGDGVVAYNGMKQLKSFHHLLAEGVGEQISAEDAIRPIAGASKASLAYPVSPV